MPVGPWQGRLDHQPLFGKGARAPHPKEDGRRPDTRERRKSSLMAGSPPNIKLSVLLYATGWRVAL